MDTRQSQDSSWCSSQSKAELVLIVCGFGTRGLAEGKERWRRNRRSVRIGGKSTSEFCSHGGCRLRWAYGSKHAKAV